MIVLFLDVTNPKTFKPVVTGLHLVQTFVTMFPNNVTMYQSMNKKTGIEDLTTKVINIFFNITRSTYLIFFKK